MSPRFVSAATKSGLLLPATISGGLPAAMSAASFFVMSSHLANSPLITTSLFFFAV